MHISLSLSLCRAKRRKRAHKVKVLLLPIIPHCLIQVQLFSDNIVPDIACGELELSLYPYEAVEMWNAICGRDFPLEWFRQQTYSHSCPCIGNNFGAFYYLATYFHTLCFTLIRYKDLGDSSFCKYCSAIMSDGVN